MASKKQLDDYESVFWALSHASRRHIIVCLSKKKGPMLGGEIAEQLSCSWPTTTGHLQTLENAGIVSVRRQGREQWYELNIERLNIISQWTEYVRG